MNAIYAGIVESLAALRGGGATLFVATSKPRIYAERIVPHFELDAHFAAVHGCEPDGTREDKRDLLGHLLPHHGIAPANAIMIGDRGADMLAARHHGVAALGATRGYGSPAELEEAGAQRLCGHPSDLPAMIREMSPAPN
jgi:phosphoglycolate phosphatase